MRFPRRASILVASFALVAAACGSDDKTSSATTATDSAPAASAPVSEAPAATNAPATDAPAEPAGNFPVTIEHKFGETTVDAEPERVVSIGYNEHDFLLALGVVPVGLRDWYGEQPNSVWPWAQDALGDATPDVIEGDLNFEQIAAMRPDLIVGVWSGMSDEDYELLSAIAPTVAQPGEYDDYGTPWQEQTLIIGRAVGKAEMAQGVVDDVEAKIIAAREAHPEWEGHTAAVAFFFEDNPGAYSAEDPRSRLLTDLGFVIPPEFEAVSDDAFFFETSAENLEPLDVDLLVWLTSDDDEAAAIIDNLPTRTTMTAFQEGRELFTGPLLTGAFSHSSPLSLEFVIEQMVAEIEIAMDGDPSTVVPSAAALGAVFGESGGDDTGEDPPAEDGSTPNGDDAATAAGNAWTIVFDSTVDFDTKAPHLAEADALQSTIEAYATGGEAFGGISLAPTNVTVDGATAAVTYDVNFGENSAYTDLEGTISLVDGVWVVSRDEFCGFMSSARTPCP